VAFATLVKPIFFKHMVENDVDVPVQLVFMLALTSKEQVDLLQQVVEVIQQPAAREQLMAARSPDEVFAALSAFERA
jgi:PTS system galactitol-specific IIA component